jgi:hypothetical protein
LARPNIGQIAVPDLIGPLAKQDLVGFDAVCLVVEQAELDSVGALREQGEVHSFAVPRRSERIGLARPNAHFFFLL